MAYILDFGIRFAAPMLGLVASGAALLSSEIAYAADGANVTVNVSNLRNAKGQLMICLTKNPKAFPDCSKDASAKKKLIAATTKSITFADVQPGTYAVAIVHDENRNNKMDLALFMPKEGFAFSRNPAIRMGPPKFNSASFTVTASNVTQNVRMKYIF